MGINLQKYSRQMGHKGFTLVEVLITLLISGIVMASIYSAFQSQQNSYLAQEQVAEMQQNIRGGLDLMIREIRMAGYDPEGTAYPNPNDPAVGIVTVATQGRFSFTQDFNEDGEINTADTNEDISFAFSSGTFDAESGTAAAGDGIVDDLDGDGVNNDVGQLGRNTGGGYMPIAENIQAVEFYYTMEDGTQTTNPAAVGQLDEIRSVQISILARAGNIDKKFTNTKQYLSAAGNVLWDGSIAGQEDNYRRRLFMKTVQCRNMGL